MSELHALLSRYRRKINLRFTLQAGLKSVVGLAIALHVYFLLWKQLGSQSLALVRTNYGIRGVLIMGIIYFVWAALRSFWSDLQVARFLDRQKDFGDDLFQNTLELGSRTEHEQIKEALAASAAQRMKENRFTIPQLYPSWLVFSLAFLFLGLASIWASDFQNFKLAARQFYTNQRQAISYKTTIELTPGNLSVGRNQSVEIKIVNPDLRLKHHLYYRIDKEWRELGLSDNSYIFNRLDNDIEYYAANEVCKSAVYRIKVLDEPIVKKWFAQYNPPAYTKLPVWTDTLSYGNLEALKHSKIKLSIVTNIPVESAVMVFDDASRVPLQALDKQNYITQLSAEKSCTWYLELTDALGRKSKPEEKNLRILNDNPPEIKITYPGADVTLNQNMLLPLIISADDDYGLRNLSLHYQIQNSEVNTLNVQSVIATKMFSTDFLLDFKSANLFPGDEITYWASVYDNSPEQQKAESPKFKARFPSIEEIYKEIERQENARKDDLENVRDKSKDLLKEFEDKRREMLKQDNPKWEDKKQLEKLLNDQEKLSDQVQDVADNYQKLIDKMQANEALSPETLQKMQKIQELMQDINNEQLQDAMKKFENALQNIKPEDLKKAMENFKFSLEDFTKKLDQTLQLLESIKKEQAVQKALQIAEETEKMQKDLSERTKDAKQNTKDLAADQGKIADNYDKMKEQLNKVDELLNSPKDRESRQQLSDLQQDMKNSDAKQDMQNSQNALQQNQRSESQSSQAQAMEKLRRFSLKLSQMKNSMSSGTQQQTMQAVQTAIRELLIFSKKHEATTAKYRNDPYQIVHDLIAHSEGIQIALNKLFAEPQVMMIIPPKFFIDLTDTNNSYRNVFSLIGENQLYSLPEELSNIQKGLNLMIYDLMQALQNASSGGGGGGGMQSLMQMLEQMSQEQMAMNMLTEQLMLQMQAQGGQMDSAMQQQIQKLASDQERLSENLKRALQNDPEAQKQGNAIKQLTEDMDSITRQLKNNQLSPDLLDKQERILSKMLDAQRSINKREFSEKRKAETADQTSANQLPKIDLNAIKKGSLNEDSFRSYPKEYQQVILQYLKSLSESGQ